MNNTTLKKRPVNLTVREDILDHAKRLNINTSKAAELGIKNAIKEIQEQQWLSDNKDAIDAHNERIEKYGPCIKSYWVEKD